MKPKLTKHGDYERRSGFTVFGYAVFIVFTTDMAKSIAGRYHTAVDAGPFQAMHYRDKNNPYSHLFFKTGDAGAGTIAHECWHVVRFMLNDWANCAIDNETIAYHLGFLVDEVTNFKYDLIDNGVGVKSKKQEVSRDNTQGTVSGVQDVQSRFDRAGRQEVLPSETNRGSVSGRCCP